MNVGKKNEKGAFGIVVSVQLVASSMGQIAGINLQSPNFHNPNQHLFTTKIVKISATVQARLGIEPVSKSPDLASVLMVKYQFPEKESSRLDLIQKWTE